MNIQFDTKQITSDEALGLIALLETLLPVNEQVPDHPTVVAAPAAVTLPEQLKVRVEQAEPTPTPAPASQPAPESTTRRRRTKAEMAADAILQKSGHLPAPDGEAPATAPAPETVNGQPKAITADELRALLNGYISRHSMDEAIGQLKTFGCNRVTEALALEAGKLSQLAAALNG